MSSVKILLVDDHKVIRDGIKFYLESEDNLYNVIGEASNGQKALDFLKEQSVDLVLLDINMDEMDGITCAKEIKTLYPETKIIALSMLNENHHIKKMINAGASGYLLKNCDEEEIKSAIKTVMNNGTYYSPQVTETIMNSLGKKKTKGSSSGFINEFPLTEREKEVLELIVKEFSNQEIADKLFISLRTVDAHKRNLLEKTGAKNIAGLVMFAINNQLFEDI